MQTAACRHQLRGVSLHGGGIDNVSVRDRSESSAGVSTRSLNAWTDHPAGASRTCSGISCGCSVTVAAG
jgi:hypothetical protein